MKKSEKPQLLEDSSSDSEVSFKINNKYAAKYEQWRHGEELQKLKDKYGSGSDISSSSSESEEEEPIIDKDFLKTLSLLKSKDPQIYDESVEFFTNDEKTQKKAKESKAKPLYPKDYERKRLLESNGKWSDEEDDDDHSNSRPTYDEEQERIKESFKVALEDSESDDNDSLLQVRQKDKAKKEQEEADYILWLKGQKDEHSENEVDNELRFLRRYWDNPDLDSDEQYLRDYILNQRFAEEKETDDIPTYEDITSGIGALSDDEEVLEKQEVFEHKFNFRFEEPDSEFIMKYPRTIGDSLRRKDNKRKLKREDYQARKLREKEQKKEELKRLKTLKRKEIEEKLSKLREVTGNDKLGFDDFDVDGDFDPNEHDKKMREVFNEDYYDVEETDKPQFPSDEELDYDNWDNWAGGNNDNKEWEGLHCEDPDFNMDADYDPKAEFQKQMIEYSTSSKKKSKKSKFAAAVSKAKPVFDPSMESFEKYFDDYYKLDYEDIIGDLPVRFKYRKVVPNDFGLTTDEILSAKDKELNRWCSLKKTCQYRKEEEEMFDVQAFKKKTQNVEKKKKILSSLFDEPVEKNEMNKEGDSVGTTKKKRRRKSKKANEPLLEHENGLAESESQSTAVEGHESSNSSKLEKKSEELFSSEPQTQELSASLSNPNRKRKRKNKKAVAKDGLTANHKNVQKNKAHQGESGKAKKYKQLESMDKRLQLTDARLKAYGINPKKFKNRLKYSQNKKVV